MGRRRPFLMLLLMLLCVAGFWYNFKHRFAAIEAEHSLQDKAGLVTPEERECILTLRRALRETWGLGVRVRVLPAPATQADMASSDGNTVLMQLVPPRDTAPPAAVVIMPALVDKALNASAVAATAPAAAPSAAPSDAPFSRRIEAWLTVCLAEKTAGTCAGEALLRVLTALEQPALSATSPTSPTPPASPQSPTAPPAVPSVRGPLTSTP